MPRFAILKHERDEAVHFDLLLERGSVLRTWTFHAPLTGMASHQDARLRFDHPKRFLTYEGPLSEGNGSVMAVDHGEYELIEWRKGADVCVHLAGATLQGRLRLVRREGDLWELGFLADPVAPPDAGAPAETEEAPELMRVGQVARFSGLSREVVNSYAMFGLIRERSRSPAGHRLFGRQVLKRLRMIGLLKQRGYTLRDIREIFLRDR